MSKLEENKIPQLLSHKFPVDLNLKEKRKRLDPYNQINRDTSQETIGVS